LAEINWTTEAERWLKDIHDYIAEDNPKTAHSTINAIYDKVQILCKFPHLGYRLESIQNREVRILLYGHYRIAYLIKADKTIDILGVFHGALDITRYSF